MYENDEPNLGEYKMIDYNTAEGVRDAIVAGRAELGLPLTKSVVNMIRCADGNLCLEGQCPICGTALCERLSAFDKSLLARGQNWTRSVYALPSHRWKKKATDPIQIEYFSSGINRVLNVWEEAASNLGSSLTNSRFACVATFGIVENTSSSVSGDKVVVVEFAVTGAPNDAHWDAYETLLAIFGQRTSDVDTVGAERLCAMPDQNLLFGYTKRKLGGRDWPTVIKSKKVLSRMACNYGSHSIVDRLITRGLEIVDDQITFGDNMQFYPKFLTKHFERK